MFATNTSSSNLTPISAGATASFVGIDNDEYKYEFTLIHKSGEGYYAEFGNGEGSLTTSNTCTCPETVEEVEEPVEEVVEEGDEGATPVFPEEEEGEGACEKNTYCIHGLAIELMPMGMIDVWAQDFVVNPEKLCPNTRLYLWHSNLGIPAPTRLKQIVQLPESIIFTCEHLGNQEVYLYSVDPEDNYNFCTTYINVQDNNKACETGETQAEGMARIAGQVRTWNDEPVEQVAMTMNDDQYATQADGFYQFDICLLYTSPSPRDATLSRMPSSA